MRWRGFAIILVALGAATNARGQEATADSLKASFWTHALAGAEAGDSCLASVDPEEELREPVECPELREGFGRAQEPARLLRACCAEAAFVTDRRIPIEDAAASLLELERRVLQELAAGRAPSLENHMLLVANLRHIMIEAWSALRERGVVHHRSGEPIGGAAVQVSVHRSGCGDEGITTSGGGVYTDPAGAFTGVFSFLSTGPVVTACVGIEVLDTLTSALLGDTLIATPIRFDAARSDTVEVDLAF